jgi:hypothetical protein
MEIMAAFPPRFARFCGLTGALSLLSGSALLAGEVTLEKVPPLTVEQVPAYPENLARYHFGAKVEVLPQSAASGNEAALPCDDSTMGYALPTGTRTVLITLSKIENIDNIAFLNEGAKGNVAIAVSNAKLPADSSQWQVVAQQDLNGEAVRAKVGPGEAKYVKLTFNVNEPGRIAGLGVYSAPTLSAFTTPRARHVNVNDSSTYGLISYNLTDVHAKSRAIYVSSGDEIRSANNMIDDQSTTTYKFAPSDAEPTAIVDLGRVTSVRRITALYTPRPGKVSFYVLESLPGNGQSSPHTLKLDSSTFANLKPVGTITDGTGRAAIDFPETTGRYILLKWEGVAQPDQPFSVAEIAAFGGSHSGNLLAANATASNRDRIESTDGKDMGDAKDMGKDFTKEMPEEAPEEGPPPPLQPPPPFTFIPEIPPNSP